MFTVLLVDDERIELDTLKDYVDWSSLGISEVYTARGARSALECVSSKEPDIIITDIQMPRISGIELVDIIRREGYRSKVVFLTGYDKFEYAKEAIRLQVEDFLLKPFQIDEVEAVVTKIVEKIRQEKHGEELNKLAIGKVIERVSRNQKEDIDQIAKDYFLTSADKVLFGVLSIKGMTEDEKIVVSQLQEVVHTFQRGQSRIVVLHESVRVNTFIQRLLRMFPDSRFQIVYQEKPGSLRELRTICDHYDACLDDLFYMKEGTVFESRNHRSFSPYRDQVEISAEKKQLYQAVAAGDVELADEILLICLDQMKDMGQDAFCQNAFSLFLYLYRQLEKSEDSDEEAVLNILYSHNYETLLKRFRSYINSCCQEQLQKENSRWASYVKGFVAKHYMEDCTVEEMADDMQVSPNYLRRKFKEEAGLTILEYLTDYRLTLAAELLREKHSRVKDIAIAVGYPNISYFTQIFAKKYGVTPNEYKRKI